MKKILVTGAAGFIGSHLCERLIQKKYAVRVLVKYNSRSHWGWLENSPCKDKLEIISGDIQSPDSIQYAMEGVNLVFHLAALIGIPYSYYSPDSYVDTNIKGTLNILQAARNHGIEKIIHTSTSEVYGSAQWVPITETHPINPQSPYAATKSAADFLALSFVKSFGLPVVVIRPFNTYGPRQSARAIIPTIITQILAGQKKIKLGTLLSTRDLTYVEDTVTGFIKAAETDNGIGEVINLGSNFEISIGNLAVLIAKIMGAHVKIESTVERKRPQKSEVERLWADNQKAKAILNWAPAYSLEEGLKQTIQWLTLNKKLYKPEIYNI